MHRRRYRQVNSSRHRRTSLRCQATALPHSANALHEYFINMEGDTAALMLPHQSAGINDPELDTPEAD